MFIPRRKVLGLFFVTLTDSSDIVSWYYAVLAGREKGPRLFAGYFMVLIGENEVLIPFSLRSVTKSRSD